jgi:hypothetical protein
MTHQIFNLPKQSLATGLALKPSWKVEFFLTTTTTPTPVYTTSALSTTHTQPVEADAAGILPTIYLDPTITYKASVYDENDVLQYTVDPVNDSFLTAEDVYEDLYPKTANVILHGADPTGVANSSTAFRAATDTGFPVEIPDGTYLVSGVEYTGKVIWHGNGRNTILRSDAEVLTVTNGTDSEISNFRMENITAPYIITRDPTNWGAAPSATTSNTTLGYQPTINDQDIWGSLTAGQQSQQIGPVIQFTGAASNILVEKITGRFVRIDIRDATESTAQDNDIRGGKGVWGAITFDNWTNGVQRGKNNRALRNKVQYASFCGVFFSSNDDFQSIDNTCYRNGESGTKTTQTLGFIFSGSVGGATSGTLGVAVTNGSYTTVFSNGEQRTVTVTGTTSASWSGALSAGAVYTASAYQSTLNPQCFGGTITSNTCHENYYDGLDCASTYPNTCDAADTQHLVVGNSARNNNFNGMNCDGRNNTYVSNSLRYNRLFGMWGQSSYSKYITNKFIGNNTADSSSTADLLIEWEGNTVIGNDIKFEAAAGYPLYSSQNSAFAPHTIALNTTRGGTNFFGSTPIQILFGNTDDSTGFVTEQSFCLRVVDTAGTIQHAFYADVALSGPGMVSRINGASSGGLTNTPTGADASTAFAAGAKIGSADTTLLYIDTGAQLSTAARGNASVVQNNGASDYSVAPLFISANINGVTRTRLAFRLFDRATGSAASWDSATINELRIQYEGKLA